MDSGGDLGLRGDLGVHPNNDSKVHEQEFVFGVDGCKCLRIPLNIPMRDGVLLAADLYAPEDYVTRSLPVVLERTPYGRRNARASERHPGLDRPLTPAEVAVYFANRDFVVIVQDCRGRGDSEGRFVKYLCEGADGFDTVEWIGSQDWCDGRVITVGLSYCAHVQTALASLGPRYLAGMFMDSGGFASAYEAGCRQGGAFEMKQVTWALRHAANPNDAGRLDQRVLDLFEAKTERSAGFELGMFAIMSSYTQLRTPH